MYCKKCGATITNEDKFCKMCGTKVEELSQEQQNNGENHSMNLTHSNQQINPSNNPDQNNIQPNSKNISDTKSNVSLIMGVISIIGACAINILIIPVAIVGLIFGIKDKQKSSKRTAGILLNILSIIVSIIILVAAILILMIFGNDTYYGEGYELEYDHNWSLTTLSDGGDALKFRTEESYFSPIGTSSLTQYTNYLNCDFEKKSCQDNLYNWFYNYWYAGLLKNSMQLYKETSSFRILEDDIYYATYNYGKSASDLKGKYYLVVTKEKDVILSFISNTSAKNVEKLHDEILELLEEIEIEDNSSKNSYTNDNSSSNENTIYNDELYNNLSSLSNWNRYSTLRKGDLGKNTNIKGGWRLLGDYDTYWEFKNGEFWWYKSVNNLNDNYWYGRTEVVTGRAGLKKAGLDEERIDNIVSKSKGNVTEDDVYTIICTPTKIISGGQDKSSTNIPKNTTWTYIWIVVDHGAEGIEGQVMNLQSHETTYYVKIKD